MPNSKLKVVESVDNEEVVETTQIMAPKRTRAAKPKTVDGVAEENRITQIVYRKPEEIKVNHSLNNRFGQYKEEDLQDILDDLDAGIGIEYPLKTRKIPGTQAAIELVAGYRRHAAVKLWNTRHNPSQAILLPVIICTLNDEDAAAANIRENVRRKTLTPIDCAVGIRALRNRGISDKEICDKYYLKSPAWLSQTAKLLQLDKKTQEKVHDQKIPGDAAIVLADMPSETREMVIQAHELDKLKFTKSSVLKVMRECSDPPEDGEQLVDVKRHSRTLKEMVDFIEDYVFSPTLNEHGNKLMAGLKGFAYGKVSDDEMKRLLYELFPREKDKK